MAAGDRISVSSEPQLPAVVWNDYNFSAWPSSLYVAPGSGGLAMVPDGSLGAIDQPSETFSNVGNMQSGGGYGIKVTTGSNPVKLLNVRIHTDNASITFRVVKVSDGTLVKQVTGVSANNVSVNISGQEIVLSPNTSYFIEIVGVSGGYYVYYKSSPAISFPLTGLIFNGGYENRTTLTPTVSSNAFCIASLGVQEVIQNATSANILSPSISHKSAIRWGKLSTILSAPAGSTIKFDIVKASDGTILLSDLTDGADLSALPLVDIKVRVKFTRTNSSINPVLLGLMVDWTGSNKLGATPYIATKLGYSNQTYTTLVSVYGSGRIKWFGMWMGVSGHTALAKVTIDGVVVSEISVGSTSTGETISVTPFKQSTEARPYDMAFSNSLLVEFRPLSNASWNAMVIYELDTQ